jgi:hypothetical protein
MIINEYCVYQHSLYGYSMHSLLIVIDVNITEAFEKKEFHIERLNNYSKIIRLIEL